MFNFSECTDLPDGNRGPPCRLEDFGRNPPVPPSGRPGRSSTTQHQYPGAPVGWSVREVVAAEEGSESRLQLGSLRFVIGRRFKPGDVSAFLRAGG